jgi:lysylphosphatidylglycerol synthetase-like protein (DUF2156 family)
MHINHHLFTPLTYLAIIVFFFLPFVNIKCNQHDIEKVKGIELATGMRIGNHHTDSSSLYLAELDSIAPVTGTTGKSQGPEAQNVVDRNNYATAALILALCGLVLSLLIQWRSEMLQGIIGLAGMLSLMLTRIQLDQSVQQHASTGEKDIFNVQMSVEYLAAYWLAVVFFLFVAAINIFSYIEQARNGITEISDGIPGSG